MGQLSKLAERLQSIKQEVQDTAKQALTEELKVFFDDFPEVEAVAWKQYTPGFNDGEPCVHSMDDVRLYSKAVFEDQDFDLSDDPEELNYWQAETEAQKRMKAFTKEIHDLEEAWEMVFGTDTMITCTRKGVEVEDYYCGY